MIGDRTFFFCPPTTLYGDRTFFCLRHFLLTKEFFALPMMEDDPDSYVKTITEVIKEPREDKKIINSVIKEVFIN